MLKALIVDDEELARRGLAIRLQKFDDVEICGECRNGREAVDAVREKAPDIVFLDVQMPGIDGFGVLRRLSGSDMPIVIFVTAYDEFALRAFEANALDYLLKPINDERLDAAINRARQARDERLASQHRSKLLKLVCELTGREVTLEGAISAAVSAENRFPERLAIRDSGETVNVNVASIDWIDAAGDYMCVHAAGDTHVLRGTMKRLEELLDPAKFVRIHRSTIVNRFRVRSLRPHRNGEYFLTLDNNGQELKLSRKYKSNLERLVG
jgi:two-component system LytT family response regulator